MTSALYISTGIALYGAVQSLHRATRVSTARVPVNILYALLCLSVAGFTASSAWLQSTPSVFIPLIGKIVIACGLLSWFTLVWLVSLLLKSQQRGLLIGLSVAWSGLLLLNLSVPASLVYFNFTPVMASYRGFDLLARLSQSWLLVHAVIAVSWGYILWRTKQLAQTVRPGSLTGWWVALFVLGGATGVDLLISAGLLSSAYLSPFAWTVLLVLASSLLEEPVTERALQFDHGEASSNTGASKAADTPALTQGNDSRTYLSGSDADSALHLHWHLDQTGQNRPPMQQNFRASMHADADITTVFPSMSAAESEPEKSATIDRPSQPLETDLAAIVQFTRIALRRIDRGKTDAKKFATLFRAIQQKAEAARDTLVPIPARENIHSLVANVLMQADAALQTNGIRVVQRLAMDLPATGVDQVILEQVLSELLHEAIEATLAASIGNRKSIVLIGRATRDAGIELSITDGGAEISLAEIQGTFESLLTENTSDREVPLIVAAELIAAQGGRLWCAPNPAGGTIRYLRLPGVMV